MNIRSSIVSIHHPSGKIVGTGFLASDDLIVTCAHVVTLADAIYGDTVQVVFDGRTEKINALVVPEYWLDVDKGDVAVLHLENVPEGITPLPLGNAAGSAGHDFYAYGYAIVTGVQGIGARGKIVDIVNSGRLAQLTSQEPDHGMSGGPVWDEKRRVVIGMVTKGKGVIGKDKSVRNIFTTFATSVEVIRKACPELRLTEICPYRSLDVFNEEDALFFFGRERFVKKLLERMKLQPRFLAVLGPSGSGKSSVVRAGLIPALRQGQILDSKKWEIITIRPATNPFDELIRAGLINPQGSLEYSVKNWLGEHPDKTKLILFIDQFEEVFVSTPKHLRQIFISELAKLLDAPLQITVILNLRDDFYSRFSHDAARLAIWLEQGLINMPSDLEYDDLIAMIIEPAKLVGITFDEGLVDAIISDAQGPDKSTTSVTSTILPLLEFSLTRLWEDRDEGRLSFSAYKKNGGVNGSLSLWANQVYYSFSQIEQRTAKNIFKELIQPGNKKDKVPASRKTISINQLKNRGHQDHIKKVLERLIQNRLLVVSSDTKTGKENIEIIHDALLISWDLPQKWITELQNQEQIKRENRQKIAFLGAMVGLFIFMCFCFAIVAISIFAWAQRDYASRSEELARLEANARATAEASELIQKQIAEEQTTNSQVDQIITQSEALSLQLPDISLLLSIEAYRMAGTNRHQPLGNLLNRMQEPTNLWKYFPAPNIWSGAAISLDERLLASCNGNKEIVLFSIVSGEVVQKFKDNDLIELCNVAFSPDGNILASSSNNSVNFWDLNTSQLIQQFPADGYVMDLAFSKDGSKLAYTSTSGNVYLWDLISMQQMKSFSSGRDFAAVDFSPDSQQLAFTGWSLNIWDIENGHLTTLTADKYSSYPPIKVVFSPDGNKILTSGAMLTLWDISSGNYQIIIDKVNNWGIDFSSDGTTIVSGSDAGLIEFWDVQSLQRINKSFSAHDFVISTVNFSKSGKYLVTGSANHVGVWLFQPYQPIILRQMDSLSPIESVAFSPDGKILATGEQKSYSLWNATNGNLIAQNNETHTSWVVGLDFSQDGKLLASGDSNGNVAILNLETNEISLVKKYFGRVSSIRFNNDGNILAIAGGSHQIYLWDIQNKDVLVEPFGGYKLSDTISGTSTIISFSPSNSTLVSTGADNLTKVWDVRAKTPSSILSGYQEPMISLAFKPDGKILASGSRDGTIVLWDMVYLEQIGSPLVGHAGWVETLAFTPTENILISGGGDQKIILWDVNLRRQIGLPLSAHRGDIKQIDISPDGNILASGGEDSKIILWNINIESWIDNLCWRAGRNFTQDEWQKFFTGQEYRVTCPQYPSEY